MVEHEQLSAGVRSRRREHEQLSAGTAGRGRGVDGLGATRAWVGTLARSRGTLAVVRDTFAKNCIYGGEDIR